MALVGICPTPTPGRSLERVERNRFSGGKNLSTLPILSLGRRCVSVRCSSFSSSSSAAAAEEEVSVEESGHVMRFKMSDFKVLDRVSVGLAGRVRVY